MPTNIFEMQILRHNPISKTLKGEKMYLINGCKIIFNIDTLIPAKNIKNKQNFKIGSGCEA